MSIIISIYFILMVLNTLAWTALKSWWV